MKDMKILFVRSRQVFPNRAAEIGTPVCRKTPLRFIPQIKEISIFSVRVLAGFPKPLMFVGTMVYDQIHQDIHAAFFCLCDQAFHVLHCAEAWINVVIIRDIVSFIGKRGAVAGRKPDDVDTQILQVIQLADNTGNITDPVAVGIIKTFRINLICYFVMPPFSVHSCPSQSFLIVLFYYRYGGVSYDSMLKKYVIMTF